MSKRIRIAVSVRLAIGLAAATSAGAVLAQESPARRETAPPETLDTVVITGTSIRGSELIGNTVQIIDGSALADSGRATIADMLRDVPVNFAGGVANSDNTRGGQDTSSAGANLTGGSGVNLRGLGALSTLVLVDGRRVAASGQFGDFVDIANIPAAAIERIEILSDGASAIYGSDAVGGVVNIILKRDVEGFNTLARLGTTTQGGGDELQVSAVWGGQWAGGRAVVGYEYNDRSRVGAEDRDFDGANFSGRGGVNWPRYTSRAGAAANIFSGGAAFNGNVAYMVPQGAGVGLTVASLTPATGGFGNSFDPWAASDISPAMERHSLFATLDRDIGERAEIYGSARFTRRDGDYRLGYPAVFSSLPATSAFFIPGTTNNFGVLIDDRIARRDVSVSSLGAELGLRFDLGRDWNADFTVSYSREEQTRESQQLRDSNIGDRVLAGPNTVAAPSSLACSLMGLTPANLSAIAAPTAAQSYCASLNYQAFNPYSTAPLSAAVLDQLIGYEDLTFNSWLTQATVKVDGSLFDLPGGALKLAAGVDYRKEYIDGELDFNYRSVRPLTQPYGATSRNVVAAFAEFAVPIVGKDNALPLVRSLDASLAVRYEDSRGLGDFDTTNPKFGLRYEPVEGFALRGSYGTSFHAPPMRFAYNGPQPVPGGNTIFYANAFYTAPCNTTLVALNGFSGTPGAPTGNCTFTGMVVSGGAGPILKPEEADTWTLGFDFSPPALPGLKLSASYFNLEIENRIVRITSGTLGGILANYFATGSSPYIRNLDFNPDDTLVAGLFADPRFTGLAGPGPTRTPSQIGAIIYATQTNLASLRLDGVDLSARYRFATERQGEFTLFATGTLYNSYDVKGTPAGRYLDKLGKFEAMGNPVRWRSKQGVSWTRGPLQAIATVNFTDGYECESGCYVANASGAPVLNTAPVSIDSWTTLDLEFNFDLAGMGRAFEDSSVSLSAVNVLDEDPPFVDTGRIANGNSPEPYDFANASIFGRSLALTIAKRF